MEIRLATQPAELAAIYRFRYAIYVEEMNRKQKYADHEARLIQDPIDCGSYILGAWENGELVGTVRSSVLSRVDISDYYDFYQIARLTPAEIALSSITTRLMIHSRHRRGSLAIRLAKAIYQIGLEQAITTDLIDCNEHLVPFFTGLGYRLHRNDLVHPEYGAVTVMKLGLSDYAHLQQIRSPFLPVSQEWLTSQNKNNTTKQ